MIHELISKFTPRGEESVRCPTYSLLKGKINNAQFNQAVKALDASSAWQPFPPRTRTASEQ